MREKTTMQARLKNLLQPRDPKKSQHDANKTVRRIYSSRVELVLNAPLLVRLSTHDLYSL